jgi:hypothetical protein
MPMPSSPLAWLAGFRTSCRSSSPAARLHQTSRSIPRALNNLALQALVAAFADGKGTVDESTRAAIAEVTGNQ